MPEPLIEATSVTRRFGSFTAVDGVSLTVEPGEIVGLLGANGAGKTTLIRMILGLLAPTSGEVRIFGGRPSRATRARLGYVPQGLGLWNDMTVAENLDFIDGTYGGRSHLPDAVAGLSARLVGGIGLGGQRRVAFAAALGHAPQLLVLDEPTSGVDPLSRARLWDQIHEQAEAGVGVLVTTHYMQEAQQCDRLVLMSQGRAVAEGSEGDITGGVSVVAVDSPRWQEAFAPLSDAGLLTMLSGTRVRVVGASHTQVRDALGDVEAALASVGPTLEEAMAARERARGASAL